MNILLIEDDLDLGNGIHIALQDSGMTVTWLRRLQDAQDRLERLPCDLLLLDLGLPDGDGLQLLARLRQARSTLPVLILTARDALEDRLRGLDLGADDYLVKPFALAELLSRVRALARRSYGFQAGGQVLLLRGLALDLDGRRASLDDAPLDLTASEFQLLQLLMMRSPRVVARRQLEELTLSRSQGLGSNTLDVHIANLRRKIGSRTIRTVRGIGYVIDADAAAAP